MHGTVSIRLVCLLLLCCSCGVACRGGAENLWFRPLDVFGDKLTQELALAAHAGSVSSLERIYEKGAAADAVGKRGFTPVYWAIIGGRREAFLWFLEKNIRLSGGEIMSVFGMCCLVDDPWFAEQLLARGFDVNSGIDQRGRTSLQYACWKGRLGIFRRLLEKGARIDGLHGFVAFRDAVLGGALDIAIELVDAGIDREAKMDSGYYAGENKLVVVIKTRRFPSHLLDARKKLIDRLEVLGVNVDLVR